MVPLASKKDRHESIGKGLFGETFFKLFMNDTRFDNIPIVLETIDETIWKEEIKYLLEIKWWEKNFDWIEDNINSFLDIKEFIKINSNK